MYRVNLLAVLLFVTTILMAQAKTSIYKDKQAKIEERIDDLVSQMTLDEKILQLNQYTMGVNTNANNIGETIDSIPSGIGSLIYFSDNPEWRNEVQKKAMEESRLGIPILFGFDVIHGFRTVYPIGLAQACSWNPALVEQAAQMAAKEAKLSGIDWTFSPMIDVARDGRWGRVAEGYGEDSYANAVFGVATVKGYQGKDLAAPYSIAACLKHYVGYGESEGGRDYRYSDISHQALWETYLPPYEACVKAGAATLMSAFNDISGVPATANKYTLTDILKEKWGHDGFVVSDWDAIKQLINQGVAKDEKEACYKAFMAGVEMDMVDNIYVEHMEDLVTEGRIPMAKIDDAVSRILRVKFRLGLFDHPYTTITNEKERYLTPEYIAIAEKLAEESIVLLKNKNEILPVSSKIKSIAIVGPMAKDQDNLLGAWSYNGVESDVVSIFAGLEREFKGKVVLNYAKGCDFDGLDENGFDEALDVAQKSDLLVLCLGEKKYWSGENASRSTIALPTIQEKLIAKLKATGKPVILVLSNGRPLELNRLEPMADAIIELWQPGVAGGNPFAGILSGRINPSGKLAITFPLTTGQIPVYYNMRQSARIDGAQGDYQDISTEPLYWFGHGLSYTTFEYGTVKLSATRIHKDEKIYAEVEVSNTGSVDGKETVLWFISDPYASISRPLKELKYFEKKLIANGEKTVFTFEINPMLDLSFPNSKGERILETGEYQVIVKNQVLKFELID
ncbi:MAG: glycoside hydrolase family 3 N-terminal domain-containing protein [Prolixibacteraceae bacterium]